MNLQLENKLALVTGSTAKTMQIALAQSTAGTAVTVNSIPARLDRA